MAEKYTLRPYQQSAVNAAVSFLTETHKGNGKTKDNGIIIAPTGSGKSLLLANIARRLGGGVLVFQPSKEILDQNLGKLLSYGETATVYSASKKCQDVSPLTFATIGSVKSRAELFKDFRYIFIDECPGGRGARRSRSTAPRATRLITTGPKQSSERRTRSTCQGA